MHVHELNPKMAIGGHLADNFHTQVDRMAAHKMNFFSAMTTADIPFDIAKNGQWELEMQVGLTMLQFTSTFVTIDL